MPIVQDPDAILRATASTVPPEEIATATFQSIIATMHATLRNEEDGVALAAPQIGIGKRIFVIAPKAYKEYDAGKPLVFINPEIIKTSRKKVWLEEGCLSVRWWYGKTHRHTQVTVRAQNADGIIFEYGGSGLIAQIFQHEIDHLNGVLFRDHAKELKEMQPEEIAAYKHEQHKRKEN